MTRIDGELEEKQHWKEAAAFLDSLPKAMWLVEGLGVGVKPWGEVSPGAPQCFGGCQAQTSVVLSKEMAGATAARNNPVCAGWLLSDRNNPLLWSF